MWIQILILGLKGLIGMNEIKRKSKREEKRARSLSAPSSLSFGMPRS